MTKYRQTITVETERDNLMFHPGNDLMPKLDMGGPVQRIARVVEAGPREKVRRRYRYTIAASVEIDETERHGASAELTLQEHLLNHLAGDREWGGAWFEAERRDPIAHVIVKRDEIT